MDRVVKYINKTENLYDALVEYEKARGYDSDAEEEVIARCCESFLANRIFVQSFAKKNYKSAKAISAFLTQMNTDMRRVFDDAELRATEKGIYNDMSPEQEILSQVADIDDIAMLWSNAVNKVGKRLEQKAASVREETVEQTNGNRASKIDNKELLRKLENGETVKVYRAMQVIDGKLYPPMAAKVADERGGKGKLVEPTNINEWYQADERPDLIDPKTGSWKLDKANGAAIRAAYNPYFHTSTSPLNDQFSSAYKRDNLVVVEGEVPKSELTSGYKAQYAKDAVGAMRWHSGTVSAKLKTPRTVILSRYFKANRILSDAEVASKIKTMLDGEDVSIPQKLVTPGLYKALNEAGVKTTAMDEERASTMDNVKAIRQFADDIEAWDKNGRQYDATFHLGSTGNVLQGLGAIENDIYMLSDKIRDILSDHGNQGMTIDIIKQIPQIVDNPYLVLSSRNIHNAGQNTRLVMFGNVKTKDGKTVLAVLDLRPIDNGIVVEDMQKLSSAYVKDKGVNDFFNNSDALYVNKKKTPALLRSLGFKMPSELQHSGYIGSITHKGRSVNISGIHFSDLFASQDNNNRNSTMDDVKLSDKQYMDLARRYESGDKSVEAELRKAVDDAARAAGAATLTNGKVKKYYHGTRADFTIFDIDKARRGTYGYGFYVTAIKDVASHYVPTNGRLLPLYLMTDNLATRDDHRITEEMVSEIVQAYDIPGDLFHEQTISQLVANESDAEIIRRLANYIDDETTVKPSVYLNAFREVFGYDGLRMPGENIVWSNDLLKSAELITYDNDGNIIPLSERFNENEDDIRFSTMDNIKLNRNGNTRTFELKDTKATLIGNDVELKGGTIRQRVTMMKLLAEHNDKVRVDAASAEEAEAFRRAGAEQDEMEGRGKYGTFEFKYQRQVGQDIYDPKQKVKFAKDIVKYKMPGIAA